MVTAPLFSNIPDLRKACAANANIAQFLRSARVVALPIHQFSSWHADCMWG
jgi:hypothetical protein